MKDNNPLNEYMSFKRILKNKKKEFFTLIPDKFAKTTIKMNSLHFLKNFNGV